MRITAQEAARYWAHPSQQIYGVDPGSLPGDPFTYYAHGPFCGVAHPGPLRDVWIVDYAVLPEAWGTLIGYARDAIKECWLDKTPSSLIGFTRSDLRHAVAFISRVGFRKIGTMTASNGEFIVSTFGEKEWALIQ